MKENKQEKSSIRVTEGDIKESEDFSQDSTISPMEKLKKPLIFGLMGIVFLGCLYLIFNPSSGKEKNEDSLLNESIPEATSAELPMDKGKAYEQEMLDRKEEEKRKSLLTLSDYWNNSDKTGQPNDGLLEEGHNESAIENQTSTGYSNPSLNSYRNMQNTLGNFYEEENSETKKLREELEELKEQLAERDIPEPMTIDDQLALMEKSYQIATKYLPGNNTNESEQVNDNTQKSLDNNAKADLIPLIPTGKNSVTSLYRQETDTSFLREWFSKNHNQFYSAGSVEQPSQAKNSIKAVVQETQTIVGEAMIRLRLLEAAKTPQYTLPAGTLITANAKFQSGRLQLNINSIEWNERITPVDIVVYDLDGQQGLAVPYSPEMNALSEMAGNMSQNTGTSIMLTQSAGQQAAADLGRGVIQGVSGYFSKKVRTPKVTLKAGYQVLLLSKTNL